MIAILLSLALANNFEITISASSGPETCSQLWSKCEIIFSLLMHMAGPINVRTHGFHLVPFSVVTMAVCSMFPLILCYLLL